MTLALRLILPHILPEFEQLDNEAEKGPQSHAEFFKQHDVITCAKTNLPSFLSILIIRHAAIKDTNM
jgi:hypothetical protein